MYRLLLESGAAVVAVGLATLVRVLLDPLLGDHLSALIFVLPVVLTVWRWGWRAALLATLLGYMALNVLFGEPSRTLTLNREEDVVELLLYVISCLVIVGLGHHMRSAAERADSDRRRALAQREALERETTRRLEVERTRLQLASIVESSEDAILSKDLTGIITSWNGAAERLYGYSAEEIIGRSIGLLIPPNRTNELAAIMDRIKQGDRVAPYETVRLRKDGQPVDVSLTISPLRDETGTVVGASAIVRDIAEQKRSEAQLRALQDRLAVDLESLTRLHDMSLRFVQQDEMQGLLEEILETAIAVTRADMGNIQLLDAVSGTLRIAAQRGFDQTFLNFFDHAHIGQAACGTALERGERVIVPDVTQSPIFVGTPALDVMVAAGARAVQSTPLFTRTGRLIGMFSTHYRVPRQPSERDIWLLDLLARQAADFIERMQIQGALRVSEERFKAFMDHSPATAFIKDSEGRYLYVSRVNERVFHRPQAEWIGRRDADLFPAAQAQQWRQSDVAVLASGEPARCIETAVLDDGMHHYLSLKFPLEERGKGRLLAGMSVDITELKQAEEALRQANLSKDQFLTAIAHELGSPLVAIQSAVRMLQASRRSARLQAAVEIIQRQSQQLSRLVTDLLDASRLARDSLALHTERVELASVVRPAMEATQPLMEDAKQEIVVTIPPEPLYVNGDPVRLTQVFTNLLSNATRYTGPGGSISLTVGCRDGHVVVAVRGTGAGIPQEAVPRIFELFAESRHPSKSLPGGLGIGLALVKRLVEMHGGSVSASSDGPGMGSEFVVRLPALRDAPERAPLSPQIAAKIQRVPRHRRLDVDGPRPEAHKHARRSGQKTRHAARAIRGIGQKDQ